jgi:hypothetical protein
MAWNVRKKDVTFRGVLVPAEHGIDGLLKLNTIGLIYAARIGPEVLQVVVLCLFAAKLDLVVTRFVHAGASCQVFERILLRIRSPRVRKNGIRWNIIANKYRAQNGLAISVEF